MTAPPKKRARKPRPGLRGPGSKPARTRSIAEFSKGFKTVSSDRGYAKTARRTADDRRKKEREADGTAARERAELEVAKLAWANRTATPAQKKLVRRHEDALFYAERARSQPSPSARVRKGFSWGGGWVIEGKVWRDPFVEKGFRTWEHPFMERVAASMATAKSGNLRTGPTKDGCVRQWSKTSALDMLYGFFSDNCRDMWRLDCDKIFANEAELRSWIAYRIKESGAPCAPHIVDWIPDDRFPGRIEKPHIFFLLPEGHAVWPQSPDSHHRLLDRVIAALCEAFDCDEGGLANPYHGKIPLSPFTDYIIPNEDVMPILQDYAEALQLTWDPQMMFRQRARRRLEEVGYDPTESNTFFTVPSLLAASASTQLFHDGFDVSDEDAFEARIAEIIAPETMDVMRPTGKQLKIVENMIARCARWAARTFDTSKANVQRKDRGACAHLIKPGDDLKTKRRVGQAYVAEKRSRSTRAVLVPVYRERIKRGADHSRTAISKATDRCYNTIKHHEFRCEVEVIAEQLVAFLDCGLVEVKGMHEPWLPISKPVDPIASLPGRPTGLRPPESPPPDPGSGKTVHLDAFLAAFTVPAVDQARHHVDRQPA